MLVGLGVGDRLTWEKNQVITFSHLMKLESPDTKLNVALVLIQTCAFVLRHKMKQAYSLGKTLPP